MKSHKTIPTPDLSFSLLTGFKKSFHYNVSQNSIFNKSFKILFSITLMLFAFQNAFAQINEATYVDEFALYATVPEAIAFNSNDSKIYIASGSIIKQYSRPNFFPVDHFNNSEASVNIKSIGIDLDRIKGMSFSGTGNLLYVVGAGGAQDNLINIIKLSTSFDLSTASKSSITPKNISSFSDPQDIQFNNDGSKAYLLAPNQLKIYEYHLSSPYILDANTPSPPSPGGSDHEFVITGQSSPTGFVFNANGSRLYLIGTSPDRIAEYYLSENFEISDATGKPDLNITQDGSPQALAFINGDRKLYVVGDANNKLYEYSVNAYPIVNLTKPSSANDPNKSTVSFNVVFSEKVTGFGASDITIVEQGDVSWDNVTITSAGNAINYNVNLFDVTGFGTLRLDIKEKPTNGVIDYTGLELSGEYNAGKSQAVGAAFNVADAASYVSFDAGNILTTETRMDDITVSDDGLKMFILGKQDDMVYEFNLSTAYRVSTASYAGDAESLDISAEPNAFGFKFVENGTTLFVQGGGITKYTLSTPYDVSTAQFQSTVIYTAFVGASYGFDFSDDGLKLFVLNGTQEIFEFSMSTAYDISTLTYTGVSLDVSGVETRSEDIEIVNNGTTLLLLGSHTNGINTYRLTTANTLAGAQSFGDDGFFSVVDKEAIVRGFGFSPKGDIMYIVGLNEEVYSYRLNDAPIIKTFITSDDSNPSNSSGTMDITFSETITGLSIDDFELTSLGTATGNLLSISGSQESYILSLDNISGDGALSISIKNSGTDIMDNDGLSFVHNNTATYVVGAQFNVAAGVSNGTFDLDDEDTNPISMSFSWNGDKMYVLGATGLDINTYALSTAFDVTTATYLPGENLDISAQDNKPRCILINKFGTKVFMLGDQNRNIHEYYMTTPFDLSTAVYNGIGEAFYIGDQENEPYSLAFNFQGNQMYVMGSSGDDVNQYSLSRSFDVSTATYQHSFSVSSEETKPYAMAFDKTGSRMFVLGDTGDDINVYFLSTLYDVSTAVYAGAALNKAITGNPYSLAFDSNGNNFYVLTTSDFVYQYKMNANPEVLSFEYTNTESGNAYFSLKFSKDVTSPTSSDFEFTYTDGVSVANNVSVNGTGTGSEYILRIFELYGDGTFQLTLKDTDTGIIDFDNLPLLAGVSSPIVLVGAAFDPTNATYLGDPNAYTITEESAPTSLTFNTDGSKMYITGTSSDDVHEYALSTAYDLTTVSFTQTLDLSGEVKNPTSITFNNDGTKLYILSSTTDNVSEYSLSSAYDISTANYLGLDDTYSVADQATSPYSISFNEDGTVFYMMGSSKDINPYQLATAYDISTASDLGTTKDFSVSGEILNSRSFYLAPDGKKLLLLDASALDISEYELSEAYEVNTASYSGDTELLDLSNEITTPRSISFNNDGTKMFVVSDETDNIIHAYDLNTAPKYISIETTGPFLKRSEIVHFRIILNETVNGFDMSDLELVTTGSATANMVSLALESDLHYLFIIDNIAGEGTIQVKGKSADTGIVDLLGKPLVVELIGEVHEVDLIAPTATISIDDTALKIGDTPTITMVFSEEVISFTKEDLIVANGTVADLSTTDNITFTTVYTPTTDVEDDTNEIVIDMSLLLDVYGNRGVVDVETANFTIDTKQPTVTIDVANNLNVNNTAIVTITFDQEVTGFEMADVTIENATLGTFTSPNSSNEYIATLSANEDVEDDTNVITIDLSGVVDLAGNDGTGNMTSNNYTIDNIVPTYTITMDDHNLTVGETAQVTITFSEAVNNLNGDLLIVSPNGIISGYNPQEGDDEIIVTFTPNQLIEDVTNVITLVNQTMPFKDLNGNEGLTAGAINSGNYIIDGVIPMVQSISIDDATILVGETATFTIVFSEVVSGFENADLTIPNGTLTEVSSEDRGITYTATFTPSINVEDESNIITIDETAYTDTAGNAGVGSTFTSNFIVNTIIPTVVITMDDDNLLLNETALVTFTFSEAVTGFENADITIPSGTLSAVSSSDGNITFTATFTPTALTEDLTNIITVDNTGYTDDIGNTGLSITDSENFTIDGVIPTSAVDIVDLSIISGETTTVTFTFSEAVLGFENDDLTYENGTLSVLNTSDGGITYTSTFTPNESTTDITNTIVINNLGYTDAKGNTGSGTSTTTNFEIDTTLPTLTISMNDNALIAGETSTVTFTFSEQVLGFDNTDITIIDNGTLTDVSSIVEGITFTAVFTPNTNIEVVINNIEVNLTGVQDIKGNIGTGTSSIIYLIDTNVQSLTASLNDSKLLEGETATLTVVFSEAVAGFEIADIDAPNGLLSNLTTDDDYNFSFTYTPTVSVFDETNVITIDNTKFTDRNGNVLSGTTTTENYIVNTVIPTIAFETLENNTYGDGSFDLTAIASSNLTVTYVSSDLSVATISENTVTIIAAGTTTITASQSGDEDKNAAVSVEQSLTVEKAILTTTVADKTKIYGQANPAFTVVYSGYVNDEDIEAISTQASISTIADEISSVASYDIIASGAEAANYSFSYVKGILSITAKELTATAENKSKIYGAANPILTISYVGFENGDGVTAITEPTISTTASQTSDVGTYDITLTDGSANNYFITNLAGLLSVTPKELTATADDKSKIYGEENPAFTITYTGFENGDDASVLSVLPTASSTANNLSNVGTYDITVSGGSDNNYTFNYISGLLTVIKADQTISFTQIADFDIVNQTEVTLEATNSSGLDIIFTVIVGNGSITGNTLTVSESGSYQVEASHTGNENYNAASTIVSFNVTNSNKTDQTITFSPPTFVYIDQTPLVLEATTDSGLTIEFEILTGSEFANLSGNNMHLTGAGTVEVAAKQSGNDEFNPAVVTATIEIKPLLTISGSVVDELNSVFDAGVVEAFSVEDNIVYTSSISSGAYSFDLKDGTYYLSVVPTDQSTYYTTLYGDVIFWENATLITVNASMSGLDIQMIAQPSNDLLTGIGSVTGRIIKGENSGGRIERGSIMDGDPVEGVSVFLVRLSDEQIMTEVISDANGDFQITGIPEGEYRLQIEITGVVMDLGNATISVDAVGTPIELTALVGDNGIVLEEVITSLDELFTNSIKVFPNPFRGQLNLQIENELLGQIDLQIISTDGTVLYSSSFDKNSLNYNLKLDGLNIPSGILILRMIHEDAVATFKLLKN